MQKVLYVVGAGLVVGAVAATFYFLNNKKKKNAFKEACEYKNLDDKVEKENSESSTNVIIANNELVYEDVKSSVIESMYSRHEGAATVISDSIDALSENIKISGETNDEIDDISAELDRMISED